MEQEKVALCYFGQPRTFRSCYQNHFEAFIKPFGIEDIFCHIWWDEGKQLDCAPWSAHVTKDINKSEGNDIADLISIFRPKSFSFSKPIELSVLGVDKVVSTVSPEWDQLSDEQKKYSSLHPYYSAFNSVKSVASLLKNYSESHRIKYDWVVLTRYDIQLKHQLTRRILDQKKRGACSFDAFFIFKTEDFFTWASQIEKFEEYVESFHNEDAWDGNWVTPEMMQFKFAEENLGIHTDEDFIFEKQKHVFHRGTHLQY